MAEVSEHVEPAGPTAPAVRPRATTALIVAATVLAAALRLYPLTLPGHLHGLSVYDEGVYFGDAVQLTHGVLPYRDYVAVHPPGIMFLLAPVALLSHVTGTATALGVARVLTALVGAAAVPTLGAIVRHRGTVATGVGCLLLAVHSDTVAGAGSVLLEPWLMLFVLLGLRCLFVDDRFAIGRRRTWWGGALLGVAVTVKIFALLPLAVVLAVSGRRRLTLTLATGSGAALLVLAGPFAALAPRAFVRSVVIAQLVRHGVRTKLILRLGHLIGLNGWPVIDTVMIAVLAIVLLGVGWWQHGRVAPLAAVALAATAGSASMLLAAQQFYGHYDGFFAPFLALALALAVPATIAVRCVWTGAAAALVVCLAISVGLRSHRLGPARPTPAATITSLVPAGACVVTDNADLALLAGRFSSSGCPVIVDGFGTEMALSHGYEGRRAWSAPLVQRVWLRALRRADYLLLPARTTSLVPWVAPLPRYVRTHFDRLPQRAGRYRIYRRRPVASTGPAARGSDNANVRAAG